MQLAFFEHDASAEKIWSFFKERLDQEKKKESGADRSAKEWGSVCEEVTALLQDRKDLFNIALCMGRAGLHWRQRPGDFCGHEGYHLPAYELIEAVVEKGGMGELAADEDLFGDLLTFSTPGFLSRHSGDGTRWFLSNALEARNIVALVAKADRGRAEQAMKHASKHMGSWFLKDIQERTKAVELAAAVAPYAPWTVNRKLLRRAEAVGEAIASADRVEAKWADFLSLPSVQRSAYRDLAKLAR